MRDKSPIMKLPIPSYTKYAYSRANPGSMKFVSIRKGSKASSTMQQPMNLDLGEAVINPYQKDVNDEAILFRLNAAKPLVDEKRLVSAVHNRP